MKKSRYLKSLPNVVGKSFGYTPALRTPGDKGLAPPEQWAGAPPAEAEAPAAGLSAVAAIDLGAAPDDGAAALQPEAQARQASEALGGAPAAPQPGSAQPGPPGGARKGGAKGGARRPPPPPAPRKAQPPVAW
jgi:hypothetical protein